MLVSGAPDDTKKMRKAGADIFAKSGPEKTVKIGTNQHVLRDFPSFSGELAKKREFPYKWLGAISTIGRDQTGTNDNWTRPDFYNRVKNKQLDWTRPNVYIRGGWGEEPLPTKFQGFAGPAQTSRKQIFGPNLLSMCPRTIKRCTNRSEF